MDAGYKFLTFLFNFTGVSLPGSVVQDAELEEYWSKSEYPTVPYAFNNTVVQIRKHRTYNIGRNSSRRWYLLYHRGLTIGQFTKNSAISNESWQKKNDLKLRHKLLTSTAAW